VSSRLSIFNISIAFDGKLPILGAKAPLGNTSVGLSINKVDCPLNVFCCSTILADISVGALRMTASLFSTDIIDLPMKQDIVNYNSNNYVLALTDTFRQFLVPIEFWPIEKEKNNLNML
jgi:hypothetical protein